MQTIRNTRASAKALAKQIISTGQTAVFDLDGVILDATARQAIYCKDTAPTPQDVGALNLAKYRELSTPENIAKDKSMALLETINILNKKGINYHVCTARIACKSTRKLLIDRAILPDLLMSRQGESDRRRDDILKTDQLLKHFSLKERLNMVLIDDNARNLEAVQGIGLEAIYVPFKGH